MEVGGCVGLEAEVIVYIISIKYVNESLKE